MVAEFKNTRMKEYEMSDLGLMRYFLGIEVKQGEIFISQEKYVANFLKKFNMLKCKSAGTSMTVNEKLQ
jgi:hypothetical protein